MGEILTKQYGLEEDGVKVKGVRAFVARAYSLACLKARLFSNTMQLEHDQSQWGSLRWGVCQGA